MFASVFMLYECMKIINTNSFNGGGGFLEDSLTPHTQTKCSRVKIKVFIIRQLHLHFNEHYGLNVGEGQVCVCVCGPVDQLTGLN